MTHTEQTFAIKILSGKSIKIFSHEQLNFNRYMLQPAEIIVFEIYYVQLESTFNTGKLGLI